MIIIIIISSGRCGTGTRKVVRYTGVPLLAGARFAAYTSFNEPRMRPRDKCVYFLKSDVQVRKVEWKGDRLLCRRHHAFRSVGHILLTVGVRKRKKSKSVIVVLIIIYHHHHIHHTSSPSSSQSPSLSSPFTVVIIRHHHDS